MHAEREALKAALQRPGLCGPTFDTLTSEHFTFSEHKAIFDALVASGGTRAATSEAVWVSSVRDACPDDPTRALLMELAVEPLLYAGDDEASYVNQVVSRLREFDVTRRVVHLKARMQRMNPVEADGYNRIFGELMALEALKRQLRTGD